jgi:hypothetical protein
MPIENANFFPIIICRWKIFCRLKYGAWFKYKNDPVDTSLKEDLSIYATFDPS